MTSPILRAVHDQPNDTAGYLKQLSQIERNDVTGTLERGRILNAARSRLAHGEWRVFAALLPFVERTAHRYRAIEAHPVLRDPVHLEILPSEKAILYALARLHPDLVLKGIRAGIVHPRMALADVERLGTPGGGKARSKPTPKPWDLPTAFSKIRRALLGAPSDVHREIGRQLHELADQYSPVRPSRGGAGRPTAGRAGQPDFQIVKDLISSGLRSMAGRHHPDRPGGNVETMKAVNLATEWLRDRAGV
jgi:hypothetical protein